MTKQIKYVGVKEDGETAFFSESGGITWMPGDSHPIADKLAERMLNHPDVFAEDDGKKTVPPAAAAKTATPPDAAGPLAGMDDKQVKAFARKHGLEVKGLNVLKGDNLRAKVLTALPK